jgi:GNAT superfamily N-acetyltransferase
MNEMATRAGWTQAPGVRIEGPTTNVEADCERVLRTLPEWFGVESSLLEYARNTRRIPTFVVYEHEQVVAFLSLEQHFPQAWELSCIAVEAGSRNNGLGRLLHAHAEAWLRGRDARILQVKTLAASHPSRGYAETRSFYERLGYVPVEVFPTLWAAHLPVLLLVKHL